MNRTNRPTLEERREPKGISIGMYMPLGGNSQTPGVSIASALLFPAALRL